MSVWIRRRPWFFALVAVEIAVACSRSGSRVPSGIHASEGNVERLPAALRERVVGNLWLALCKPPANWEGVPPPFSATTFPPV